MSVPPSPCGRCQKPGRDRCSRCRKECYADAWAEHKVVCKPAPIQVVRLGSAGYGAPAFDPAEIVIDTRHPIWRGKEISPVSRDVVGMPLIVYPSAPTATEFSCPAAVRLMFDIENLGFAANHWQMRLGSCIVARQDREDLEITDLEPVWRFCEMMLAEKFGFEDDPRYAREFYKPEVWRNWLRDYHESPEECKRKYKTDLDVMAGPPQ